MCNTCQLNILLLIDWILHAISSKQKLSSVRRSSRITFLLMVTGWSFWTLRHTHPHAHTHTHILTVLLGSPSKASTYWWFLMFADSLGMDQLPLTKTLTSHWLTASNISIRLLLRIEVLLMNNEALLLPNLLLYTAIQLAHPSSHPSMYFSFLPSIHPYINLSCRPSMNPSFLPFIHPFSLPSTCSFIHPSMRSWYYVVTNPSQLAQTMTLPPPYLPSGHVVYLTNSDAHTL